MFLGGLDKGPFLAEFEPGFFFDDQAGHCQSAARVGPTELGIGGSPIICRYVRLSFKCFLQWDAPAGG